VRLATRLGYSGFADLQADVQAELAQRLPPATARIRQHLPTDVVNRARAVETDNLDRTFSALDPAAVAAAVDLLAARAHGVWVLPGEVVRPAGQALADRLEQLRDGVRLVGGSEVRVRRHMAALERGDVVVAIDLRRYERWLVTAAQRAVDAGASLVAITDGPLSPLAPIAQVVLTVSAAGVGPFDSLVGIVALADVLVAGVAARVRTSATHRLDAIEHSWGDTLLNE